MGCGFATLCFTTQPSLPSPPPNKCWASVSVARVAHPPNSWLQIIQIATENISLLSRPIDVLIRPKEHEHFNCMANCRIWAVDHQSYNSELSHSKTEASQVRKYHSMKNVWKSKRRLGHQGKLKTIIRKLVLEASLVNPAPGEKQQIEESWVYKFQATLLEQRSKNSLSENKIKRDLPREAEIKKQWLSKKMAAPLKMKCGSEPEPSPLS